MKVKLGRKAEPQEVNKIIIETNEDTRFHIEYDEAGESLSILKYSFKDGSIKITPSVSNKIYLQ